jgi:hypothetical protein
LLKTKGVSLRFYRKTSGRDENWPEICISSPWDPYSYSAWHYSVVQISFRFCKISSFGSKPKGITVWFYRKMCVHSENKPKICISSLWGTYSISVRCFGVAHKFLWVLKNIEFRLKTQRGFGFADKRLFTAKTCQKFVFHLNEVHIIARLDLMMLYPIFYGFEKYQVSAQNLKG